jgi:hypothetical protein
MDIHWGDIVLGHLFIGFVIGFLAAWSFERWAENKRWKKLKAEAGIEGTFTAYLFRKDFCDIVDYSQKSADDEISYVKENIFKLVHRETNGNIWEGYIYMGTPKDGRIAWKYVKLDGELPASKHRVGFKRCLVSDGPGKDGKPCRHFYLLGEDDYGNEILERTL